jgi:putative aldouronate transport system permease protein
MSAAAQETAILTARESIRPKRKSLGRAILTDIRTNKLNYLLVTPAVIYVFVYGYVTLPFLVGAFQRYHFSTGLLRSPWVGFANFRFFFGSNTWWQVTWNTLRLNLLSIGFGTAAAVFLAIMLNEVVDRRKTFARGVQSVMIFPHFLSWMVVSHILYAFLATRDGIVNQLLAGAGLDTVYWYGTPGPWTAILTTVGVWKGVGVGSIIFLSAMAGFDPEIYEAAEIDGASPLTKVFRITIPLLMPVVTLIVLLRFGRLFNGDFGMIYAIVGDNGMLFETTDVIDTYVFRTLRRIGRPSQAMAVGLYQSVVGFVLVYGSNRLVKRYFPEGALF